MNTIQTKKPYNICNTIVIKNKKTIILLAVIIAVSSIFRLTNLDIIEFKTDEAINLLLAAQPRFGNPLPPGGTVSSVGILNPPLFTYLLSPLTFFTLDPRIISFVIAFINVLAIAAFFLLFRKYYGLLTAFISTIFMALSPWMILFSRKIWTQDLILPFTLPFFFSLHKIVIEKKLKYWTILTSSAFFLIQLHQASLLFIGPIFIFLLYKKVTINYKYAGIGILIGLLPFIPYISYQIQNGCLDCRSFMEKRQKLEPMYSQLIFMRPLQIIGQGNFQHVLGKDMLTFKNSYPLIYWLKSFFYLEYILLPIGIMIFIKKYKELRFLAYGTLLLPFIYFLLKIDPFIHYFIIASPLLFLFFGTVFSHFLSIQNRLVKTGTITILLFLFLNTILFNIAFFSLLIKQRELDGDYGKSFAKSQPTVQTSLYRLKDDSRYEEMFLMSYIPKTLMHGDYAIPQMLFKSEDTEKNLKLLEQRLIDTPEDPLPQNELTAYYTKTTPTRETLKLLKRKSIEIPGYVEIYSESRRIYQDKRLKNLHEAGKMTFEYPLHWKEKTTKDGIFINNDKYVLVILQVNDLKNTYFYKSTTGVSKFIYLTETASIRNQIVKKTTCADYEKKWCGILYENVVIGKTAYTFILLPTTVSLERMSDEIEVMNDIISSMQTE